MNTMERAARHVATTAGAAEQALHGQAYPNPARASSRDFLEQAAEVLLVLELPLAEIERLGFACLFERRLRRAYEGVAR